MQSFVPNDPRINRSGRPRELDRELARLEEAARHVETLCEREFLILLLSDADAGVNDMAPTQRARVAALNADARHLRGLIARLKAGVQELPRGGRRRRRRHEKTRVHTPSQWERDVAAAAAVLDRLVGEEVPQ